MDSAVNIIAQKYCDGTWIAFDDDQFDGDPADIGHGSTREEAIADLRDILRSK